MLSLTSAKSGALIGVLISVTTIPAAANIGVAAALGDWSDWRGAMAQLGGQPDRDRARRRRHPLHPAPALRAAPATPPRRRRRAVAGLPADPPGARRSDDPPARDPARAPSPLGTAIAAALGAVSFGVALGVGQLCFAATLVWVLLRAERSASSSSASCRSSGVVTLRFSGGDGWISTLPPAASTSIASSVAAATSLRIGRQRRAQRLDPEHLRRLRRPQLAAIQGLLDDECSVFRL